MQEAGTAEKSSQRQGRRAAIHSEKVGVLELGKKEEDSGGTVGRTQDMGSPMTTVLDRGCRSSIGQTQSAFQDFRIQLQSFLDS